MRLPLSTGASAFTATMGVWLIGAVSGLPLLFATKLPDWTVFPLGFLAAGWMFGVLFLPFQLKKLRASDLIFGEHEIEILGGPAGGTKIPLDRADLRLVYSSEPDAIIKVASLNHESTALAESDDPEELASFEALIELTHAASTSVDDGSLETVEVEKEETSWVSCVSCGRPLAPSVEKSIQCRACGASNPVPEPVRTGVEAEGALAETRVRADNAVQGLLDQPRPWRVNLALFLCSIPVVVTWPVLGAFFDEFYQCRGVFHWTHGIPIFFGGVGLSVGGLMFVRAQIEGRIAHRVLVTAFRASRPAVPGAPWTCGQCGGPLPEIGQDRVVVRCVYCRTDQILGIDLPGRISPARKNARDLENELRFRTGRRRRYRLLGAAAIGIAVLGALLLREPLRVAFAAPSRNTKCVQTPPDPTPVQ